MKKSIIFTSILILLFSSMLVAADNAVEITIFHGQGCPHCAKALAFFESIQDEYPTLTINEYEVYFNEENRALFASTMASLNTEITGVPAIIIDNKVYPGFSDARGVELEKEIQRCLTDQCASLQEDEQEEIPEETTTKLTIPAVIAAAAVDAINPCAFAVLIILLTTILISKNRKKALMAGIAFSIAIFISYFLMGLGLYTAINAAGITHTFFWIVAILAIIIGLFNLKDYLWYGKWFIMEVPRSWRPKMKGIIKGVTSVPGALITGFIVSLFLLPCTSGPYIVILGLLAKTTTQTYATWLLLLYNLIFILPMIIITLAIYFGITTTEKAEKWRQGKLQKLHLIAGIILLLLGIGMIIGMTTGLI